MQLLSVIISNPVAICRPSEWDKHNATLLAYGFRPAPKTESDFLAIMNSKPAGLPKAEASGRSALPRVRKAIRSEPGEKVAKFDHNRDWDKA
jgi:hypothetical protein